MAFSIVQKFSQFQKFGSNRYSEMWRNIFQWKHITLYLEASSNCNARCTFCPIDEIDRPALLSEEISQRVESFVSFFPRFRFRIFFHHLGEPLLNKNLESLIKRFTKKNTEVWVSTNGALLDKNRRDSLHAAGLRNLWISFFYTNEEEYAKNTKTPYFALVSKHFFELMEESKRWERIHVITMSEDGTRFKPWFNQSPRITFETGRPIIDFHTNGIKGNIKRWARLQIERFGRRHFLISSNGSIVFTILDPRHQNPKGNILSMTNDNALTAYLRSSFFLRCQSLLWDFP